MRINPATIDQIATPENGLSNRQVLAVAALIKGYSWDAAAAEAGCSYASIKRWHTLPQFKAAIADGQRQALQEAAGKLAAGCTLAVNTLTEIAAKQDLPPSVRVRASEVILNSAIKAAELGRYEERIAQLEAMLNATE